MKKPVIGIIGGRGQMGQFFKPFFEKQGYEVLISGRTSLLNPIQMTKKSDVVIVSVPIDKTEETIKKVAPHVKKSGLLMDLTSFKEFPMEAMKKTKASYLGCHPMFGPTSSMKGQLVIICPGRGSKWQQWLQKLLESNGVNLKIMNAKKHDEIMAYAQVLTHFTDIAFTDTLRKSKISINRLMECKSPVYRLHMNIMGRILNQDANLYANIQIRNSLSKKVIQDFINSCQELLKTIESEDIEANMKFFKRGAKYLGEFTKEAQRESDQFLAFLSTLIPNQPEQSKKKYQIAVLGPRNTSSDLALHQYKKKADAFYAPSISEVFEMVSSGKAKEGIVPIENTLGGSVVESLDELYAQNVSIHKVIPQPIHLALIGSKEVRPTKIRRIYSHAQPFLQTRRFTKKNCKKASLIPVASTATALERVARENREDTAAIASAHAASMYNLVVIEDSIEDDKSNTTYFAVIRKGEAPKSGKRTSIAFHFKKDSPGSLHTVLQDFSDAKINLTKIESRPNNVKGEYVFYIDFQGNPSTTKIQKTLKKVESKVANLKILGSY